MTATLAFALGVAALLMLAGALLLPALRERAAAPPANDRRKQGASSAALRILREQRVAVDADLAAGRIDDTEHALACAELRRRALDEDAEDARLVAATASRSAAAGARPTIWALGLAVPAFAVALYAALGEPRALQLPAAVGALQPDAAATRQSGQPEVPLQSVADMTDTMARRLAARPAGDPADADGWTLLARSYAALQRFAEAADAYARASALAPGDAQLLADHADVLAVLQGNRAAGEPSRLIERALALDPANLKALSLAGSAAFERGDVAAATAHWQRALELAPVGSAFAAGVARSLAEARAAASASNLPLAEFAAAESAPPGERGARATAAPTGALARAPASRDPAVGEASASPARVVEPSPADPSARLQGSVRLSPALAAGVAPDDTVFVVARAVDGPRMPLAVQRLRAGDLPAAFVLDDSQAMAPGLRLSGFERVVVTARISRSGDALPQPGDLLGESGAVSPRTTAGDLQLVIDRVQP